MQSRLPARNGRLCRAISISVFRILFLEALGVCVAPAASAESEEHALTQDALEIARPFGFPITFDRAFFRNMPLTSL
jgi:hypothetical protein